MKKIFNTIILSLLFLSNAYAQKTLSINEALNYAQAKSLSSLESAKQMEIAYWRFINYRADLLPNIVTEGSLPQLSNKLNLYQNENGSYKYIRSGSMQEDMNIYLEQNIPFTGGKLSFKSSLQRIDQLGKGASKINSYYMAVPISVELNQPIISYNPFKWNKKLEPLKYRQSCKIFAEDMEQVNIELVNKFFNVILASESLKLIEQNVENAKKLLIAAEMKKKLGIISQNDIMQLQLNKNNFTANEIEAKQTYHQRLEDFKNFLGITESIECLLPVEPPLIIPLLEDVMSIAKENSSFIDNLDERLISAQKNIAYAKSERGFRLDAFISAGITGADRSFSAAYRNTAGMESVRIGFRVPILDWRKGKGKVALAKTEAEVEDVRIEREMLDFETNIRNLVEQLANTPALLDVYKKSDSIANIRYKIAYDTFLIGQISILDLDKAQLDKDTSRGSYIEQLYLSWLYFYTLRQITLYDFNSNRDIIDSSEFKEWTNKFRNSRNYFQDKENLRL